MPATKMRGMSATNFARKYGKVGIPDAVSRQNTTLSDPKVLIDVAIPANPIPQQRKLA